jgi:hypothetical protein
MDNTTLLLPKSPRLSGLFDFPVFHYRVAVAHTVAVPVFDKRNPLNADVNQALYMIPVIRRLAFRTYLSIGKEEISFNYLTKTAIL